MADSWEDHVDEASPSDSAPSLNVGAAEWTPNASAAEWKPSWVSNDPPAPVPEANPVPQADLPAETEKAPAPEAVKEEKSKPEPEKKEETPPVSEKVKKVTAKLNDTVINDDDLADEEAAALKDLPDPDPREHLNVVFIGHVDAGKSTLSGSILYSMGTVDKRTIEKYEKEAKDRNRESWFLAFIMDTNEEERAKGKTVEVGRAHFATDDKRYTILDAPGHKNYVPAMIAGASQADVGILVISARKGEFEAGFDRLGQTREHAMLAKTLGVQKLIVVVNKMDEQTVKWDKNRYDHCVKKITPFLKQCGFRVKRDVIFIPISAITGDNVKEPVKESTCKWAVKINENKSLLQTLNGLQMSGRDETAPLRIPVLDRFQDRGLMVMGKVDSGNVRIGQKVQINPGNVQCTVDSIFIEEEEVQCARVGENITLKLKGASEDEIVKGFVVSDRKRPGSVCKSFVGKLQILQLLEHRSLFTAGYKCIFHAHTIIEECTIKKLLREMDMKTGKPKSTPPRFAKSNSVIWCRIEVEQEISIERFEDMMQLGRFTLRDEGKTIAIGKVVKLDALKKK
mmetsp:Transcript_8955/g.11648  ORF Transcript_8955/g.11648 Transcript_8955/m.11648 type:complete len:568 (+) Transcript_8955:190-1893(+)